MGAEDFNPYEAPASPLEDPPEEQALRLAERGTRFTAQFADGFITGIPYLASAFICGLLVGRFAPALLRPSLAHRLLFAAISFVLYIGVYLAINGWLLATKGQTVGKKVCKIRIARLDGSVPTLAESFLRRELVLSSPGVFLANFIPGVSYLIRFIDVLFIFRGSRKCLHDDIAGTIVVME